VPNHNLPVFFVSYARADAEHPEFREHLKTFIGALNARVAGEMGTPLAETCFMDENIQVGGLFSDEIRDALMRCRAGLALYTPNYFTRRWCGQEFQVLLSRRRPGAAGTGIIPVRWVKSVGNPPQLAAQIQYKEGAFPAQYATRGMRKLVELRSVEPQPYADALDILTDRIVEAANQDQLMPLAQLDLDAVPSAWEAEAAGDPRSHTQGKMSKTCFVFVSKRGWDWAPYDGAPKEIGALAQKITGELGLKYEEIPCDANLPQKLREANEHEVPTVLVGDPETILADPAFTLRMRQYDAQYLLNCGALVPWESGMKDALDSDPRWIHLKTNACPQKIRTPPLYHEWRSVFSREDLDLKTRTLIEQIRSGLINQIVSDSNRAAAPKIPEDATLVQNAAALGINTASLSHLPSPS
jgi:hypothetical protein